VKWLAAGATDCLQWVFPSVTGTPLDASNWQQFEAQVRQVYPTIKSKAGRDPA